MESMRQRITPQWAHHAPPRKRLLIEDPRAAWFADFSWFTAAGFDVAVCTGPTDGRECPVLSGRPCALMAEADVVLFGLGATDGVGSRMLAAAADSSGTPTVVEVSRGDHPELPANCTPMPFPVSVDEQIRVLHQAASARAGGGGPR